MPMPILYIETNFLISHATGRDARTDEILTRSPDRFRIVIPGVCFMEAFEAEPKRHNRLVGDLQKQIGQSRRNVVSAGPSRNSGRSSTNSRGGLTRSSSISGLRPR